MKDNSLINVLIELITNLSALLPSSMEVRATEFVKNLILFDPNNERENCLLYSENVCDVGNYNAKLEILFLEKYLT